MQFLESIYNGIIALFESVGTIITFFLSSITNFGTLISKFPTIFESVNLVNNIIPTLFLISFTSLLSTFIAIRALRFITLQG